ncbi:TetR/AcrR family transcriptional regulator [Dactylosporangium aurantiacum]|uniref:TetR/AcrR family transcriptional regulator n=1 Tax=Dactylosporangium aurantiacum TaxID=35754 RepID=A0A9Q9IME4_9ACTN|nr:TetR/AcrR family transcriptional regulator [Dactylosporangium aurantiacum]MDG6103995.1 TetR/AcrR family transcriptional regulator [Dactylosporangium aurantiacum]UWZ58829.1 TetR/AcrR family transcriptional regulator [Dactylosporangium aurantiacum]
MQRSRAAVIATTLELLTERGVAATTIEAVAERSGVAKTTIYRHWPGQEDLVLEAFAAVLRPPADPDTGTLRGDLVALATGFAKALTNGPAAGLMLSLIDAAERQPAYAALHRREAQLRHDVILAVIVRGIVRHELPPATDPTEVLDLIAGPIFHRRAVSRGTVDPAFATQVVDRVLRSYATLA